MSSQGWSQAWILPWGPRKLPASRHGDRQEASQATLSPLAHFSRTVSLVTDAILSLDRDTASPPQRGYEKQCAGEGVRGDQTAEVEGSTPARLTLMVMRSPAYMARGSSSVAPSGYAGVGAAGDTSASTCGTHNSPRSQRHSRLDKNREICVAVLEGWHDSSAAALNCCCCDCGHCAMGVLEYWRFSAVQCTCSDGDAPP